MALVESPLAVERLRHEALSDEEGYGQRSIEELCSPEDPFDFGTLENTLVKEQDRRLGDCKRDGV